MGNEESERFKAALKDDADAVAIIAKFYKDNKIPLELMQHKKEDPKYSVDEDKAPDATFSDAGSRNSESGGIIAIMEMIKEDTENEMKTSREDDAQAEADYEKQRADL